MDERTVRAHTSGCCRRPGAASRKSAARIQRQRSRPGGTSNRAASCLCRCSDSPGPARPALDDVVVVYTGNAVGETNSVPPRLTARGLDIQPTPPARRTGRSTRSGRALVDAQSGRRCDGLSQRFPSPAGSFGSRQTSARKTATPSDGEWGHVGTPQRWWYPSCDLEQDRPRQWAWSDMRSSSWSSLFPGKR